MKLATIGVGLAAGVLHLAAAGQEPPTFRATARSVLVDVSVKQGNNPVLGLRASDFILLDNGVPQEVSLVSTEAVPLDISVFVDISGSTHGVRSEINAIVADVLKLVRPGDRFRLLTNGLSIRQTIGWTEAGVVLTVPAIGTLSGVSLVYDGVYAAVLHKPAVGRRHLVIALTDGQDDCSVIRPEDLPALAARTETVVHWIPKGGFDVDVPMVRVTGASGRGACPYRPTTDTEPLASFVRGTGGVVHGGIIESLVGDIFKRILDDYRQSYVLSYIPKGVTSSGWHVLKVDVEGTPYSVRARPGYSTE